MTSITSTALDAVVPAPYGQACESCTRSKTKCLLRRNETCCERCRRLKRDCHPVATRRRRTTTSRQTTPGGRHALVAVDSAERLNATCAARQIRSSSPPIERPPWSIHITDPVIDLSATEADECLATFRGFVSHYFPFIHISPPISAQHLRAERPFLWLNIVAITAKSSSRQQQLGALIRQRVAQNMIIKTEKSLDLLQGLLAFLSWYSYLTDSHTQSSLSVFAQLAISLVYDLGLHKQVSQQPFPVTFRPADKTRERTVEERRAALACFLITSSISHFIQRTDPLRWTPYLAGYLDELAAKPDRSAEDELLVYLVRCQVVVERSAETFESVDRTPPTIYVQALQAQIEDCRRLMPASEHSKAAAASLHLITTEILIYQMGLSRCLGADSANIVQRVKYLYACTESIKAWFEIYFTIPASQHYGFPFSITSQIVRCLQLLYHLSTLDDPAWNSSDVRSSIDVLITMDQVINNLSQVPTLAGLSSLDGSSQNVFARSAHQFQSLRANWATALSLRPGPSSSIATPDTFGSANDIGVPEDWEIMWPSSDWWAEFPMLQPY